MTTKLLYLHVGAPKTGSTAIQNFLAANSNALLDIGYSYELSAGIESENGISSGNGEVLFQLINEGQTQQAVEEYLASLFDKLNRVILSSELFSFLTADSLYRLKAAISNVDIEVRIILFVRDVRPLAISDYDQRIKRHGEHRSFDEYLKDYSWQHYDVAVSFYKVFGKDVIARSYDSIIGELIEEFLNIVGINHSEQCLGWCPAHKFEGVNRGLTSEERYWLLKINKVFGKRYSSSLSDAILRANKGTSQIYAGRKELIDAFDPDGPWEAKIEEVNKIYELCTDPIRIARDLNDDPEIRGGSGGDYQYGEVNDLSLEGAILLWSIDRLKEAFDESLDFVIEKMSASIDNSIPKNFDPVLYLLKNKDILVSDHDPTLHYLKFGRQEGREFEIKGRD